MSTSTAKVSESHVRLMTAIGDAVRNVTMISPMSAEDIIAILGFTTGAGIAAAQGKQPHKPAALRDLAIRNLDLGLQQHLAQPQSPIIMPN